MAKIKYLMSLASTKHIAPNVLHVALKANQTVDYIPGQFITLHFNQDNKEVRRSYSISNPPGSSEHLEFAISYYPNGIASEALFHMEIGDTVEVSGPAGRLVLLEDHPKRYVLVATGTGVTPYRAMLDQIKQIINDTDTKFLLLFGVRNQEECLYYNEFVEFSMQNSSFQFEVFYSRKLPINTGDTSSKHFQHKGYVQSGFTNYNLDPTSDMIYLCGNPNMIDSAYEQLQEHGFNARNVRREKYISSK